MMKYDKFGNIRHQTVVPQSKQMQNAAGQMLSNSAHHMKHYYNNENLKTGHT